MILKENGIMSEVKIAERITIDEPHNVEIAIMNLTGRAIDFELIKKFIVNEKNTMFYLNRKLNSSTEYGTYNDFLWLDTGIRDNRNNPIMIGLLFEQMEKMQEYIDELLLHIEKNEKDSQEEIIRLKEQNKEYKRALVDIRTFMQDENDRQDDVAADMGGHSLLGRNEKILVLGNADIRVAEMRAIAREYFGFEKTDFEFITDYEKVKNAGSRIHASERFAAVIFGNCPHKVAGMGNYSNIIDEFKDRANCPIAVDARNEAGGLKITKQSFKKALADICRQLKIQKVA